MGNMAAKPIFTNEQKRLIREAALRVWEDKFKGKKAAQTKMALAVGVSQQSISNLLKGSYKPSLKPAKQIATLDGKNSLEELIGVYGVEDDETEAAAPSGETIPYSNLTICIQFHASTKHWSPWTIAAARAGFFGNADFAAPEWAAKLDVLERALERARRSP